MNNKPSVFQVGEVRDDGRAVVITGWGLGLCVPACPCHAHPIGGGLSIDENQNLGTLGLRSHREGGCNCCEPWTSDELAAMLRDLAAIEAIEEIEVLEVVEVIEAVEAAEAIETNETIEGNEGVGL